MREKTSQGGGKTSSFACKWANIQTYSQPCNPSMVQARDAIIDADVALTGGKNACEIWQGFAKRGLGAGAVTAEPRVDNFDLPAGVC